MLAWEMAGSLHVASSLLHASASLLFVRVFEFIEINRCEQAADCAQLTENENTGFHML